MIGSDYVLEVHSVFHTAEVSSCVLALCWCLIRLSNLNISILIGGHWGLSEQ